MVLAELCLNPHHHPTAATGATATLGGATVLRLSDEQWAGIAQCVVPREALRLARACCRLWPVGVAAMLPGKKVGGGGGCHWHACVWVCV